jgi:hypothetical protein
MKGKVRVRVRISMIGFAKIWIPSCSWVKKCFLASVGGEILVLDDREVLDDPGLQNIEGFPSKNTELHPVRRVVLLVEVDELVAHIDALSLGRNLQGLEIAALKATKGVFGI